MKHAHSRLFQRPFRWPQPPFEIALIEPEIPPNTGNIARLCAATGTVLHLVGRLGFRLTDSSLKRAGLDYWDSVDMRRHRNTDLFLQSMSGDRCFFLSAASGRSLYGARFQPGDMFVFGCESGGLPRSLLEKHSETTLGIPMLADRVRSLNLAAAAAVVLYEALRQVDAFSVSDRRAGV